jgi:hypothetical protein
MISATMGKAKLMGLIREKVENLNPVAIVNNNTTISFEKLKELREKLEA